MICKSYHHENLNWEPQIDESGNKFCFQCRIESGNGHVFTEEGLQVGIKALKEQVSEKGELLKLNLLDTIENEPQ